jgi:Tfp pilus assembly protein PilX
MDYIWELYTMNNKNPKRTNRIALFTPLANENGVVLIITVIILLLLTLIGVSGIKTASTDIQITSNYRIHNLNLTSADAAVNRAISRIAYNQDDITATWVNDVKALYTKDDKYFKNGTWDGSDTTVLNAIAVDKVIEDWDQISEIAPATMPNDANVEFVIYINTNSADGNSVVIARSRKNGGDVIIEAGFNKQ